MIICSKIYFMNCFVRFLIQSVQVRLDGSLSRVLLCTCMMTCVLRIAPIVPAGSPSRGGDVAVYVFDINQPSLLTPFYSVLVSVYVFIGLSTVFHFINSPDKSPLSHSILPVLFLPY